MNLRGWFALVSIGLMQPCLAVESGVMHIGTLMQISPQHQVVITVAQAYRNLGLTMQLETLPLERLRIEVMRGDLVDGNLAAAASLEQITPQLIRIPVPIYLLELTVFSASADIKPSQWSELRPLRVAYLAGMLSVEARLKEHQVTKLTPTLNLEQALQYVAKGRVDIALLPRAEALYVLARLNDGKVHAVLPSLDRLLMYHYIHQKHKALVGPLTSQLEQIMAPANLTGQH